RIAAASIAGSATRSSRRETNEEIALVGPTGIVERPDRRAAMVVRLRLGRERGAGHLQDASGGSGGMTRPDYQMQAILSSPYAERYIRELEAKLADAIRIRE